MGLDQNIQSPLNSFETVEKYLIDSFLRVKQQEKPNNPLKTSKTVHSNRTQRKHMG